jgi:hypothetical protein
VLPAFLVAVLVVGILARVVASGLAWVPAAAFVVALLALAFQGKSAVRSLRAWLSRTTTSAFSMTEGFLRIRNGRRAPSEVRLTDVEQCFVERVPPTELTLNGTFRLVIRVRDGLPLRLPLQVPSAAQAQFVADRISTMLETDGRAMNVDYRGAPLRIAMPASPVAAASHTRVQLEDHTEEPNESAGGGPASAGRPSHRA